MRAPKDVTPEGPARPEYVTDVAYVRAFEPDLSPSRLRLVAALNGFTPPDGDDFDYCELGSAHGDTTATLAAAYPRARFIGIDLNREHIADARALAARGGLDNVTFLERDFEGLGRYDLPAFDYITAHGVVSWVSPAKRQALVAFAAARLKPGGLLYVSYNALPGWAQLEPLRQLIVGGGDTAAGGSLERARAGLDLARALNERGAEYFENNPAARAMLKTIDRLGLPYVVHEYLHAHWVPMYFAQVAAEMAASGLHFTGQLPLYLNYRDVSIPERLAPLFQNIGDRVTFESLKDYALNEFFRRDIYMKASRPQTEQATRAYVDREILGVLPGRAGATRELRLPHHTLHFAGPVFDPLFPALEEGASTLASLLERPSLAEFGAKRVGDALVRLMLGEQVVPMRHATFALRTPIEGLVRMPLAYNRAQVHDAIARGAPVALASVAAGTGVEISVIEAVAILLLTEVAEPDRAGWLQELAQKGSVRVMVRDTAVNGAEERERVLTAEIEQFRQERLPTLLDLGVLTR